MMLKKSLLSKFSTLSGAKETIKSSLLARIGRTKRFRFRFNAMYLLPFVLSPNFMFADEETEKSSGSKKPTEMKDIIRGEYENRIRAFSSIEKKYAIFANVKNFDYNRMNYFQFFDSLIPFSYSDSILSNQQIQEKLEKNDFFKELMSKIDVDGDKTISFEEYLVLTAFTSIHQADIISHFKKEEVTVNELASFVVDKICSNTDLKITNKSKLDGRTVKTNKDALTKVASEFVKKGFKKETVSVAKDFVEYKVNLIYGVYFYEFNKLEEVEPGRISMQDFAKVIITYANFYHTKNLLKKINNKAYNFEGTVSLKEFAAFFFFLHTLLDKHSTHSFKKKDIIDLNVLRSIADKFSNELPIKLEPITDMQLITFLNLFDEDQSGSLEFQELNDVVLVRCYYNNRKKEAIEETNSLLEYVKNGINFIRSNLWFLN